MVKHYYCPHCSVHCQIVNHKQLLLTEENCPVLQNKGITLVFQDLPQKDFRLPKKESKKNLRAFFQE